MPVLFLSTFAPFWFVFWLVLLTPVFYHGERRLSTLRYSTDGHHLQTFGFSFGCRCFRRLLLCLSWRRCRGRIRWFRFRWTNCFLSSRRQRFDASRRLFLDNALNIRSKSLEILIEHRRTSSIRSREIVRPCGSKRTVYRRRIFETDSRTNNSSSSR